MAKKIQTVPEMVTNAIDKSGLTRLEFAARCGVSRKTVFMWESGKDSPGYQALLTMVRGANTQVEALALDIFLWRDGLAIQSVFGESSRLPVPNGKVPK